FRSVYTRPSTRCSLMVRPPPTSTLFPYTTLFRSVEILFFRPRRPGCTAAEESTSIKLSYKNSSARANPRAVIDGSGLESEHRRAHASPLAGEHDQFRSGQRQQTEERSHAQAADLYHERRGRAPTARRIAKAAEVAVGRVMSVGDKDEILVRCFGRWIGQLQDGTHSPPPLRRADRPRTASAVQQHLLEIFLPFLEFFAAHEDLS